MLGKTNTCCLNGFTTSVLLWRDLHGASSNVGWHLSEPVKVYLWSTVPLQTFTFIQALPELIIFGFSMCGFGPCGFMCVVVAIGHNKVTTYVSSLSSTPYSGACNHQIKAPQSYGLMVVLLTSSGSNVKS